MRREALKNVRSSCSN